MYIPKRYEQKDRSKIISFVRENSFAIIVTVNEGIPIATHIPLLFATNEKGEDVLTGHISRGNDQKLSLFTGAQVLCIFSGPHAYVSPHWYTAPNVPTWNYISVHAYGTLRVLEEDELRKALSAMVDTYEQHLPRPMKMEEIPSKMFADSLRGIIGFEIVIQEFQAAYKLSQNRDEKSFHSIIEQLSGGDAAASQVARAMQALAGEISKHH